MATNPNTQSVEPIWWLSEPTVLTNVPTEDARRSFEFDAPELQAVCDGMGEDLEMAMVAPFPVIVVADMSLGEVKVYKDYTSSDLGEPFWEMTGQKQVFAQSVKGKWKQIPKNKTLGNWPAKILALNFGGMQLFSLPMPTTGPFGSLGKKLWSATMKESNFQPIPEIVETINRHSTAPRPHPKMEYPVLGEKMFEMGETKQIELYVLDRWLKSKGLLSLRDKDSGLTYLMHEDMAKAGSKSIFKESTPKIV